MAYIIDGHNLIGVLPDIELADPDDEERLLLRLRAYRARHRTGPLMVFFDAGAGGSEGLHPGARAASGAAPSRHGPGVVARFAEPGQTADDAIAAFLQREAQPGQYAVVTDDQELGRRVHALGASVIRASDFAARLLPGRKRSGQRSPAPDATPNPHAPAYADLYTGFMSAEKARARFESVPEADVRSWIERLYADDVNQAQLAARWLGQHGGPDALVPLRDATTHSDARVRAAALLAMGDLGDARALPDLCHRLANDRAALARGAAAQSLGRIGDHSVEGCLETAADVDPKGRVRKAARDALAQVKARPRGRGGAKPPS